MESCPSCGQLSRSGARFCTTCGHKLIAADAATSTAPNVAVLEPSDATNSDTGDEAASFSGWPTNPTSAEDAVEDAWEISPTDATVSEEATVDAASGEEPPGFWPATPAAAAEDSPPDTAITETEAVNEAESVDADVAANAEAAAARDRATGLLDELREAIAAISGEEPRDLSGVISELEVAVTPPGAIEAEALNELREALLKARERPRDIDTIVDLTGRLDAIVALIFAYDRTVAAIERSLEALRGDRVMG